MKKINLSYKGPSYETAVSAPAEPEERTYYPSFHIPQAPMELFDMAGGGEATITFKVVGKSMSENAQGKKSCSMEIEVHSITPKTMSREMKESKDEAGDAIDHYLTGKKD